VAGGGASDGGSRPDDLLEAAVRAVGGVPRAGQQAMAQAVAIAAETGEHLLVQAGTGTGKSLAYLVPAIAHAVATGRPVVVSTATLALQAQIVDRDLPRVADALAPLLGRRPTWQIVKGRRNYVCRHKVIGGFPADDEVLFDFRADATPAVPARETVAPTSRFGREVARLQEWAERTPSGDRDELVPGVSERAWRQVTVSARECLGGQRCPQAAECFSELARDRAHEVDVVVTNHAFVAIDTFENRHMLPEHDLLILDEAHEFADRVTSAISDELTEAVVEAASRRVRQAGVPATSGLDDAGAVLSGVIEEVPEGRFATGLPENLVAACRALREAARELMSSLSAEQPKPGQEGARQAARAAVSEILDVAERLASGSAGPQGPDVAWVSRYRRPDGGERVSLHIAPLSVAGLLRSRLYEERTVVLTSATLTLGGAFDATAGSVGLLGDDAPAWRGLDVGSPFDYPRQGILYIARHLPAPGRDSISPKALDELTALVEAAGGRTLGLFSSRRAAEFAAAELRERLDVPVLCQGEDSTPTLVREFARTARTCLFGTLSLWQGVDVPGPACQLVVIDRIPFPRPDDPLSAARQQAVARSGGNGFMTVAATHAALRLAQGVGRLVRGAGDRGVVAVLDSRLATARYGGFLRASLPPFWTTDSRQAVLDALRRIDAAAEPPLPVPEMAARFGEEAAVG
jgi:ATP-dependent DNA helicase DinG